MGLPRVHFEGYTDPLDYYDSSSIFCLTSSTEGFALVLVEAMSCGCVPIAFNSYACATDIIDDEKNGYLIEPFDINKYSQRLIELMDDENIRLKMSISAKEKSSIFSMHQILKEWEHLFTDVCAKSKK